MGKTYGPITYAVGRVEVPQEAFLAVLEIDE